MQKTTPRFIRLGSWELMIERLPTWHRPSTLVGSFKRERLFWLGHIHVAISPCTPESELDRAYRKDLQNN